MPFDPSPPLTSREIAGLLCIGAIFFASLGALVVVIWSAMR